MLTMPVNERDHITGANNPKVTVVTYGAYQSPGCQKAHRAIAKTVDELFDSVRLVYRHFPLVRTHPRALRAAEAAEAAAAQGKFWEMHRLLYLRPDKLSDRDLQRRAQEIGLDLERFDREMSSGTHADQILKDYHTSISNGITGAPTIFINEVLCTISGAELIAAIKEMVEGQSVRQGRTSRSVLVHLWRMCCDFF